MPAATLVVTAIDDYLAHVPYRIVQHALGVVDGGYASMFESDSSEPYHSTFGNAVGGDLLDLVVATVGQAEFASGLNKLVVDEGVLAKAVLPITGVPDAFDVEMLGDQVANMTIAIVGDAFPAVRSHLQAFAPRISQFAQDYAKSEIAFATEFAVPSAV